jgi:DNA-binding GntR family transcriptional regulator
VSSEDSLATQYQTKQEIIYDQLHDGIVSGRYRPGERLDLDAIAEHAGTSRTPVREAMRRLESEGLVTSIPHRGYIVSELSVAEIVELYHIRAVLEGLAARLAAHNLTPEEVRFLRKLVHSMQVHLSNGLPEKVLALNRPFHEIIYRAAKAPLLYEYINNLYASTSRYRSLTATFPGRADELVAEHAALAEALISGNAEEAERITNAHHENNAQTLIRLAASRDDLDISSPHVG